MARGNEDGGGCRVRFRIEWAMWGNMNALYAAVSEFLILNGKSSTVYACEVDKDWF